ncbi:hypothetical protein ATN88_12515 [Enterovibrio coralii]|uniref:Uncharacterized protein n=1 Tax=Enterovibrio coralii TaxID=294935 RepID=A0A135I2S9_9GAMM|nr:hypothetical protein ATN88_12515 [Enterovibrio coralii]
MKNGVLKRITILNAMKNILVILANGHLRENKTNKHLIVRLDKFKGKDSLFCTGKEIHICFSN